MRNQVKEGVVNLMGSDNTNNRAFDMQSLFFVRCHVDFVCLLEVEVVDVVVLLMKDLLREVGSVKLVSKFDVCFWNVISKMSWNSQDVFWNSISFFSRSTRRIIISIHPFSTQHFLIHVCFRVCAFLYPPCVKMLTSSQFEFQK